MGNDLRLPSAKQSLDFSIMCPGHLLSIPWCVFSDVVRVLYVHCSMHSTCSLDVSTPRRKGEAWRCYCWEEKMGCWTRPDSGASRRRVCRMPGAFGRCCGGSFSGGLCRYHVTFRSFPRIFSVFTGVRCADAATTEGPSQRSTMEVLVVYSVKLPAGSTVSSCTSPALLPDALYFMHYTLQHLGRKDFFRNNKYARHFRYRTRCKIRELSSVAL